MGSFTQVGTSLFLGQPDIPCTAYEWQAPAAFGTLAVPFLCPANETPRRLFVEPLLDKLRGIETDFVDAACQYGYRVLQQLDGQQAERAQLHLLFSSLFRHRLARQTANAHRFGDLRDFVAMYTTERPRLILPGLADGDDIKMLGESAKDMARKLLGGALQVQDDLAAVGKSLDLPEADPARRHRAIGRPADVVRHYQRLLCDPAHGRTQGPQIAITDVPVARTAADVVIVDGVDFVKAVDEPLGVKGLVDLAVALAMSKVGAALIADARVMDATEIAARDPERFTAFFGCITKNALTKSPAEFDRWLRIARGRGFMTLQRGGYRLKGEALDDARDYGRKMYSLLMSWSYLWMARCYGATMLLAWLDACDEQELRLTPIEALLFRQMHLPQLYLGCLPLAFLEPQHQKWIYRPLTDLWDAGQFDPAAYQVLTDLLAVYADLSEARRAADRRIKAEKGVRVRSHRFAEWQPSASEDLSEVRRESDRAKQRNANAQTRSHGAVMSGTWQEGVSDSPRDEIDLEQIPIFTSNACGRCGANVKAQLIDTSGTVWFIVDLYCRKCDEFRRVRIAR
jgi:hypothetical protein